MTSGSTTTLSSGVDVHDHFAAAFLLDELLDHAAEHDRLGPHPQRARIEARQVEQLLDQPAHPVRLLPRRLLELRTHVRLELARAQCRERAVHGRRRRAQLVRRDSDEVQLQLVEPPCLLVQTRPLDRERDTIRDELEELHVVRGKSVVNKRADVEYADDGIVARSTARRAGF